MSNDNNLPEKMELTSMDVSNENKSKLKTLFPSVFLETRNEKGELVESIDFEKLKAELGKFTEVFESRRERYGMDWPGKKDSMKIIQEPSAATLKPCLDESVNFDTTENLFIEGDNLEVLKLLQKSYYGKVKMIYIDPPYNTGKEFIYPDNYTESLDTYLAYAGLVDDEGKKFSTNTPNEGRFHTKWLNMMYPRLYLARNLLREDGVIFISIDDNEVSNLRKLCDEIFGEENFIANVVWQKRTSPDARFNLGAAHDHILVYAKELEEAKYSIKKLPISEERQAEYKNPDNDPRGEWASVDLTGQTGHATTSQFYEIQTPSGKRYFPPEGRCWALAEATFKTLVSEGRIWFGKENNSRPRKKNYLSEVDGVNAWTWWPNNEVGHNQEATKEVKELLGTPDIFDNPKPTRLIERALSLTVFEKDIILDFFSGSCTTAHAVLDQNKEDGGNRKFIMVQLPEPCDENSEAFKAGYKSIADIGKERIRRVIEKMEKEEKEKQPGLFKEEKKELDLGFKVLKLDKSNFRVWEGTNPDAPVEEIQKKLELHVDHINPGSSQEDILYELLLKAGFTLTEDIEKLKMAGKTVYSIANGTLLICLEDEIARELIDAVAKAEPVQFICLDKGFQGNDQLKANAVQTFASRNQERQKSEEIIFRTV
jgi:adenine-specific DNA-methyltransferase